jgi:hypothetical protein
MEIPVSNNPPAVDRFSFSYVLQKRLTFFKSPSPMTILINHHQKYYCTMCHLAVFEFSLAASAVNQQVGKKTELEDWMKNALDDIVKSNADAGWKLVWGPVVYKKVDDEKTGPDNAWFVMYHPWMINDVPHDVYVVAMSGNANASDSGFTSSVVDLNAWLNGEGGITTAPALLSNDGPSSEKMLVANGFAQSVFQIMNCTPRADFAGAKTTLPNFLASLKPLPHHQISLVDSVSPTDSLPVQHHVPSKADAYLTFTGHSIGGALSPILAQTLLLAKKIDHFPRKNIGVYPTAGPSPGNQVFAARFTADFPPKFPSINNSFEAWNCNLVNSLDIVPCGYSMDKWVTTRLLQSVPTMYGDAPQDVPDVIEKLKGAARNMYHPISTSIFSKTGDASDEACATIADFVTEALRFHTGDAYPGPGCEGCATHVHVTGLLAAFKLDEATSEAKEREARSHPIIGLLAARADEAMSG